MIDVNIIPYYTCFIIVNCKKKIVIKQEEIGVIKIMKRRIYGTLKSLFYKFHSDEKFQFDNTEDTKYSFQVGTRTKEDLWNDFIRFNRYPFMIGSFYTFLILQMVVGIILYILMLININPDYMIKNILLILILVVVPFCVWIWSTAFEYWNFYSRKIGSLALIITNALLILIGQTARVLLKPITITAMMIPINSEIKESSVINLVRFLAAFCSISPALLISFWLYKHMNEKLNIKEIKGFKVTRGMDFRKHKEFAYDFCVIKNMEDGKPQIVAEKDRFLHMEVNGTTGTAKTSSVLEPSIAADLDQKRFNENFQKKECLRYLKNGDFIITKPFQDEEFSINYFAPAFTDNKKINQNRLEAYNFLKYTTQSAGMIVVSPNAALADSVYHLAKNRGFKKINRLDPVLTNEDENKENFTGLNPLYISPLITGVRRDVDITNKATVFSEILRGLYELSGASDAYFVSVNNSLTIAIAKLLMLTFEDINKRPPHPGDFQLLINDFNLTIPYIDRLVEKYGDNGKPMKPSQMSANRVEDVFSTAVINCGIWQDIYTLVKKDLLSDDMGPKMYDRANGLRLQVNNFMNHPLIRRVLCHENSVDLDKALENGEIVIVNYGLEFGQSVSMAYGLFFLLSFSKAVLRRPGTEETRVSNFCFIDEFPVLLHPHLEEFFSLHRQYRVSNTVALQTLDQLDKNDMTRYMKSVLLGLGHHVIFGRISVNEMKVFETMAGITMEIEEQKTISQTSITAVDPNYSYSKRQTVKEVNHTSGTDIRYRDFQEVTFFTTESSTPLRPIVGKVNFLRPSMRKGMPALRVDWKRYYTVELKKIDEEQEKLRIGQLKIKKQPVERVLFQTESSVNVSFRLETSMRFTANGFLEEEIIRAGHEEATSSWENQTNVNGEGNKQEDGIQITASISSRSMSDDIDQDTIENGGLDDLF